MRSSDLGTFVREALPADAERIVALCRQLGYGVPVSHVERHIGEITEERALFVAIVPSAGVVGWIAVAQHRTLTSLGRADVEGLVVEDEYRGNRIGESLLARAESWSAQRGCTTLRVLSNVVRERAHAFYRRLRYEVLKTEHVFQKSL